MLLSLFASQQTGEGVRLTNLVAHVLKLKGTVSISYCHKFLVPGGLHVGSMADEHSFLWHCLYESLLVQDIIYIDLCAQSTASLNNDSNETNELSSVLQFMISIMIIIIRSLNCVHTHMHIFCLSLTHKHFFSVKHTCFLTHTPVKTDRGSRQSRWTDKTEKYGKMKKTLIVFCTASCEGIPGWQRCQNSD